MFVPHLPTDFAVGWRSVRPVRLGVPSLATITLSCRSWAFTFEDQDEHRIPRTRGRTSDTWTEGRQVRPVLARAPNGSVIERLWSLRSCTLAEIPQELTDFLWRLPASRAVERNDLWAGSSRSAVGSG
jgi:hypothetical protein